MLWYAQRARPFDLHCPPCHTGGGYVQPAYEANSVINNPQGQAHSWAKFPKGRWLQGRPVSKGKGGWEKKNLLLFWITLSQNIKCEFLRWKHVDPKPPKLYTCIHLRKSQQRLLRKASSLSRALDFSFLFSIWHLVHAGSWSKPMSRIGSALVCSKSPPLWFALPTLSHRGGYVQPAYEANSVINNPRHLIPKALRETRRPGLPLQRGDARG